MTTITALVPTFNRENLIRDCLESVRWADEILIVDSFSTDRTLEICCEYTDLIYQRDYVNSANQKNWALSKVNTEWVIQVDTDERVEPRLQEEIQQNLAKNQEVDGYRVLIKNLLWGKRVRFGGQGGYQIRLFRANKGRWSDRDVHAVVQGLDCIEDLSGGLMHLAVHDLSEELDQFANQVLEWEFNELIKRQKRWHWWDVSLRPLAIFLMKYFWKQGFRDGFPGFYLAIYRAYYSFMLYTKLFEHEVQEKLR